MFRDKKERKVESGGKAPLSVCNNEDHRRKMKQRQAPLCVMPRFLYEVKKDERMQVDEK